MRWYVCMYLGMCACVGVTLCAREWLCTAHFVCVRTCVRMHRGGMQCYAYCVCMEMCVYVWDTHAMKRHCHSINIDEVVIDIRWETVNVILKMHQL